MDERVIVRKKSTKRYINGQDFLRELDAYSEACKKNPNAKMSNYIGECVNKIANKLATKIIFSSYSFKEDMIGDAICKMIEAITYEKFDPAISDNPFAYFSQITWNCFLQRIQKEKKESYIKHKNFENMWFENREEIEGMLNDEDHIKIIDDFEKPKKSEGYCVHKNLSYEANRSKKGRKKKEVVE